MSKYDAKFQPQGSYNLGSFMRVSTVYIDVSMYTVLSQNEFGSIGDDFDMFFARTEPTKVICKLQLKWQIACRCSMHTPLLF